MRILVENSSYKLTNLGDHAMLQAGLDRVRALFPSAELHVLTSAPQRLRDIAPYATPYPSADRKAWCRQRLIPRWPGRMAFASRWNHSRSESVARLKRPKVWERVHRAASWAPDEDSLEARKFVDFLQSIDLIVATGSGGLNDEFAYHAVMVLLMLHLARSMQKPVAMFGQGLGPVESAHLRNVMRQVLPQVNFLALREGRHGLPLAQAVGVPSENVVVTGDDAIECAYQARPEKLGAALGINVRMTGYSQMDESMIFELAEVIGHMADGLAAPCISLPIRIATDGVGDLAATAPILNRCPRVIEIPPAIEHPAELMPLVAHCRTVVTGSYHAGVFALAMGIPVIGLAASPYYLQKFLGLENQFPGGCQTIDLRTPNWKVSLSSAALTSYRQAEGVHPALLRRAEEQIASSREAYNRLPSLLGAVSVS